MLRRKGLMVPVLFGGNTGWSVSVAPSQSLGDELVANGNAETGDPPTGWGATGGTIASVADERTGGAGAASVKLTMSGASGYASCTSGASSFSAGQFAELSGWCKAVSGDYTNLSFIDSTFTTSMPVANYHTANTWKQFIHLRRAAGTIFNFRGSVALAAAGDESRFDDISVKKVTINPDAAMPEADMQVDAEFTLPASPVACQCLNLYYRIAGTLATQAVYIRAQIRRNNANTAWSLVADTVNGVTETNIRTVADVGTPERLRVKCIADKHRYYTYASGTWTQQGAEVTSSFNQTEKGANVVWNTGFSVTALRGSRPDPFDSGLSGERYFLIHGDSKSVINTTWDWRYKFLAQQQTGNKWTMAGNIAVGGLAVQAAQDRIDSDLAAISATPVPEVVMINLGANDIGVALPNEAAWKADYLYICDAINTKWPTASIYLMRAWKRDYPANGATIRTWTDYVIAQRDFVYAGPDESVFLENGDNGVTYTADGTHPNDAGYWLTAQQWIDTVT